MRKRIMYQCPACKSRGTMFTDESGRLCCSWIKCPKPCLLTNQIEALDSKDLSHAEALAEKDAKIKELEHLLSVKAKPFEDGCDCAECQPARKKIAELTAQIAVLRGALEKIILLCGIYDQRKESIAKEALSSSPSLAEYDAIVPKVHDS